jgi:hypothetical protein
LKPLAQVVGIPLENAEKYLRKSAEALFPEFDYNKWLKTDKGYNRPSNSYKDLKDAITSGNDAAALKYIKMVIDKGGNLNDFMQAKTGGKELSPKQTSKLVELWYKANRKK